MMDPTTTCTTPSRLMTKSFPLINKKMKRTRRNDSSRPSAAAAAAAGSLLGRLLVVVLVVLSSLLSRITTTHAFGLLQVPFGRPNNHPYNHHHPRRQQRRRHHGAAQTSNTNHEKNPSPQQEPPLSQQEPPVSAATPLEALEVSYGELSRTFRRDFFTHEEWVYHRAPFRFTRNLRTIPQSGIVRQLVPELKVMGGISMGLVLYNALLATGYEDLAGIHHEPLLQLPLLTLPSEPFTLSSSALSLLLVFRTNSAYKRWDEARKAWGVIVNHSRTMLRQSASWISQAPAMSVPEKRRHMKRIAHAVWLFPRAQQRHLLPPREDEEAYQYAVRQRLESDDPILAHDMIEITRHRPSRALYEMSSAIQEINIEVFRRVAMEEACAQLCNAMGECDRIYSSPVPTIYTNHAARFLEFWLLFMPFCLWAPLSNSWNHIAVIPVSAIISFFLLGIDELAIQLEEPFSVLPLEKIVAGIGKSADEHVEWLDELLKRNGEWQDFRP